MKCEGRLLIVDDERSIRTALSSTLGTMGFEVEEATTGEEALTMARRWHFDAVLLDVNMPGMGGMTACRELKIIAPALSVLMLTVRDAQDDKVEALDSGADDYITKPFHMRELMARVRAAVRRAHLFNQPAHNTICIAELEIDLERRMVRKRGVPVHLTPKEFDLLAHLMKNAGRPNSHAHLLRTVWGPDSGENSNTCGPLFISSGENWKTIRPIPDTC